MPGVVSRHWRCQVSVTPVNTRRRNRATEDSSHLDPTWSLVGLATCLHLGRADSESSPWKCFSRRDDWTIPCPETLVKPVAKASHITTDPGGETVR
jgi:hypothetical protein